MKIKTLSVSILLLIASVWPVCSNDQMVLWDGASRGLELVTIGHKKVTVYLADGRTTILGIPILVERKSNSHNLIK